MHISKALQRRAGAIRKALEKYNEVAKSVSMPTLTWKEIVEYSFLGEFDLLQNSRTDIRTAAWADPMRREATLKYLQVRQAHAEIKWLNVEVIRLRTAIHNESVHIEETISRLDAMDPALSNELRQRWRLRSMVNTLNLKFLDRIESLDGFSGKSGIGIHLGSEGGTNYSSLDFAVSDDIVHEYTSVGAEEEEDMIHDFDAITDFELSITE